MSKQSIFSILLLLVLALTGYLWYGYFQAGPPGGAADQNNKSGLLSLGKFQNIQLDTALFQDPLFKTLTPPQIIPQPDVTPGRANPFAPF